MEFLENDHADVFLLRDIFQVLYRSESVEVEGGAFPTASCVLGSPCSLASFIAHTSLSWMTSHGSEGTHGSFHPWEFSFFHPSIVLPSN